MSKMASKNYISRMAQRPLQRVALVTGLTLLAAGCHHASYTAVQHTSQSALTYAQSSVAGTEEMLKNAEGAAEEVLKTQPAYVPLTNHNPNETPRKVGDEE